MPASGRGRVFRRIMAGLGAASVALLVPLTVVGPARAADVFVQVTPSTVEAGFMVGIKASCTSNHAAATVESPAFGSVVVQPQAGFLTGSAVVPESTHADTFRVKLSCPDGRSASTQLIVVAPSRPPHGPATGFGGAADAGGRFDPLVVGGIATTVSGVILALFTLHRRSLSGGDPSSPTASVAGGPRP
jgi:hypothetical protein